MTAPKKPARTTKKLGTKAKRDELTLRSPLRDDILSHAKAAALLSKNAKQYAGDAVKHAHECGKMLLAEKIWLLEVRDKAREKLKLLKENGQPATPAETFWKDADWTTWFDAQYAKEIPVEIADRYTRLAKAHEHQTTFGFDDSPNVMRSGLLALAIYPAKIHEQVEGDVPLQKLATHLALVNRFVLWMATWKKKHKNPLTLDERARLITDFAPVIAFVDELRTPRTNG